MTRLEPLWTRAPATGAIRPVTTQLLAETYLAPRPATFEVVPLAASDDAPWAESFAFAPDKTTRAVSDALIALAAASEGLVPESIDLRSLPDGRARRHLAALTDLWRAMDGALPDDLAAIRHAAASATRDALEPLPLLDPAPCPFATRAEERLRATLLAHHGTAPAETLAARRGDTAAAPGALGRIQAKLGTAATPVAQDESVAVWGLRDPGEEAEFAAARVRALLNTGAIAAPAEVGLLVPDDPAWHGQLAHAFTAAGLPLAGLAREAPRRDLETELLAASVAILKGPAAPRMALATVLRSPLMPWPADFSARLANAVMRHGHPGRLRAEAGAWAEILDALHPATSPAQFAARLAVIAGATPDPRGLAPRLAAIRAAHEAADAPALARALAPGAAPAAHPDRYVEGVSLFGEAALPWRRVRRLILLGAAGPHWPRPAASNPFFTEGEIALIARHTGIDLPSRAGQVARRIELFRRQLGTATEALDILVPARDLAGAPLAASTGLSLVAAAFGETEPAKLVTDPRAALPDAGPVPTRRIAPLVGGGAPDLPMDGTLRLGADLLALRREDDGRARPQSPSRLETLLVSPLAWLLDEIDARDRTWAPEALDAMLLGTLLHRVLELVFPAGQPVPDPAAARAAAPEARTQAIGEEAPWLNEDGWQAERASLGGEAIEVAAGWSRFLRDTGAEILANEVDLTGESHGIRLTGRADSVLRLPDGRIVVVDHKRAASKGRRERMEKGWDLQVELYRAMIDRPEAENAVITAAAEAGTPPVTAYHLMRDGTILTDGAGAGIPGMQPVAAEVSEAALAHLTKVLAEIGAGMVRLNHAGDAGRIEKERGMKAYALEDNPLVAAFALPDPDEEAQND